MKKNDTTKEYSRQLATIKAAESLNNLNEKLQKQIENGQPENGTDRVFLTALIQLSRETARFADLFRKFEELNTKAK